MSEETKAGYVPPTEREVKSIPQDDYHYFFSDALDDQESFEIRLYRVELNKTRLKKSYLRTYIDTIPREDDIGAEFGGGRFCAISPDPKGGPALTKDINIDEKHWNAVYAEKQLEKVAAKKAEFYGEKREADPLDQVERLARIMGALNGGQQAPAPAPANTPDMQTKAVEAMFDTMLGGMKKMQTALIEKKVDEIVGPKETPPPDFSLAKEIIDFIKESGSEFFKAGAIKKAMIKKAVHEDESIQTAAADPALFQYIYNEVSKPENMGADKTNNLFTQLGFQIPENQEETTTN